MGYDKVLFFDSVPSEYICVHCGDVLENAKASPCGHILCTSCFVNRGRTKLICPVCPLPKTLLKRSKLIKLIEVDDQISELPTWCNFEGCHEHVPHNQRESHLKVCPLRNSVKKKYIHSDHIAVDADDEVDDNADENRNKKKKKIFMRIAISACLYGVLAIVGIPGDQLFADIPWCDLISVAQYAPGF
jgi:hypothetical protein